MTKHQVEKIPRTPLAQAIRRGLWTCKARALEREPATADLPRVLAVWLEDAAMAGITDREAELVADAFRRLGPTLRRWPCPAQVFDMIPRNRPTVAGVIRCPNAAVLQVINSPKHAPDEHGRAAIAQLRRVTQGDLFEANDGNGAA